MEKEEITTVKLAAYFDMGGYVSIIKRDTGYRLILIFQTKRNEVLKWFSAQIQKRISENQLADMCMVNLRTKAKSKVRGHQARVHLFGVEAIQFIDRIERYTIRHQESFKIAHVFYANYILYFKPRTAHTPTELAIAEECYQEMKALKQGRKEG